MSLIQAFFPAPGTSEEEQIAILDRLEATSIRKFKGDVHILSSVMKCLENEKDFSTKQLADVLKHVEEEQLKDFAGFRDCHERAPPRPTTPECLKELVPPPPIASLVWIQSSRTFEGFYQIPPEKRGHGARAKKHWSRSRTYGDKHTVIRSLVHVTLQVWSWHKAEGEDTC
jgi:hypothetical protein